MKKGQIIRKMTKCGCPIGQYMIVTKVTKNHVYARYLGNTNSFPLMLTATFREYSKGVAKISYRDYYELKSSGIFYTHKASKQWENLYDKKPRIIKLYTVGEKPLYFVVDFWCKRLTKGQSYIRVYFTSQIYDTTAI